MFTQNEVDYLKELYRNIFYENADNSKEFVKFVQGNPNSLRIKVEDWITENTNFIIIENVQRDTEYVDRFASAYKLDTFITNYIENHYA